MSDSVRPHRRQPTRLHRPWDSPGKNTGVGCHFLLQCMKVKSESEVDHLCPTLHDPMDCSLPGFSIHGIFQARVLEWGAIAFSEGVLGVHYYHHHYYYFNGSLVGHRVLGWWLYYLSPLKMGVHCLLIYSVAVENYNMNLSIVLLCHLTFPSAW